MSGIVGILNRDGVPVNADLLGRMVDFLAFRGPDARESWIDGAVGFGHTLLRTTRESEREKQPCSLEGQIWITADVRIDAREDLISQLQAAGRHPSQEATDPELILHAYHAWKEQCVEHLLGDFAFAIWDSGARRLFCARDHFGVKQFYYSQARGNFLFSNTLRCIRLSPTVSSTLNDAAVADFLLFSVNQNPATTTFRDIQRLPEGHYLIYSEQTLSVRRYWSLPVEAPIFYKRAGDYVEHFSHLLRSVVRDRLRTDCVGVFMSGGLDSSGLAATARDILSTQSPTYDLRAFTVVYDRLIPDQERYYAGLVADTLRIPIQFLVADEYGIYERRKQLEQHLPELVHRPLSLALGFDQYAMASAHCRVLLYGEGPDNALGYEWRGYILNLFRTFRWGRLLRDLGRHARHRAFPFTTSLGGRLRRWHSRRSVEAAYPQWIRPEILKLASRLEPGAGQPQTIHPFRPIAFRSLTAPLWRSSFEAADAGSTSFPIEVRHPYMDIRVVRFLLSIPPIPWCWNKALMRRTLRAWGSLPEVVVHRPKTPVQEDPLLARARITGLPQWNPNVLLSQYVDPQIVARVLEHSLQTANIPELWQALRPVSLNFFLDFNLQV